MKEMYKTPWHYTVSDDKYRYTLIPLYNLTL